ncbi:hypothetical protein [Brevibacterium litoralis]|uniref:hypothetical protein n=1 Tax=Brevibacterium litoralis TaxID=3138935 RepID=UPI0032EAD711
MTNRTTHATVARRILAAVLAVLLAFLGTAALPDTPAVAAPGTGSGSGNSPQPEDNSGGSSTHGDFGGNGPCGFWANGYGYGYHCNTGSGSGGNEPPTVQEILGTEEKWFTDLKPEFPECWFAGEADTIKRVDGADDRKAYYEVCLHNYDSIDMSEKPARDLNFITSVFLEGEEPGDMKFLPEDPPEYHDLVEVAADDRAYPSVELLHNPVDSARVGQNVVFYANPVGTTTDNGHIVGPTVETGPVGLGRYEMRSRLESLDVFPESWDPNYSKDHPYTGCRGARINPSTEEMEMAIRGEDVGSNPLTCVHMYEKTSLGQGADFYNVVYFPTWVVEVRDTWSSDPTWEEFHRATFEKHTRMAVREVQTVVVPSVQTS